MTFESFRTSRIGTGNGEVLLQSSDQTKIGERDLIATENLIACVVGSYSSIEDRVEERGNMTGPC